MFLHPRFSYDGSKTAVTALAPVRCMACTGTVRAGYCMPGGYTGGYTRYYPAAKDVPTKRRHDSGAGPGRLLQGAWSGWSCCSVPGTSAPTPAGPGQAPCALPGAPRANAASWANKARFDLILLNIDQNRRVSPVLINKACHSPCFQNGSHKSALQIPRFPVSSAFSHKELIGPF